MHFIINIRHRLIRAMVSTVMPLLPTSLISQRCGQRLGVAGNIDSECTIKVACDIHNLCTPDLDFVLPNKGLQNLVVQSTNALFKIWHLLSRASYKMGVHLSTTIW